MVWSNAAASTCTPSNRRGSKAAAPSRNRSPRRPSTSSRANLPELNLDHLYRMTDSTGIFQHAIFTAPNLREGYCTDDNARALILAVLLGELEEAPERVRALATTYAAFLNHAFDPKTKRFHNFLEFRPPLAGRAGIRRFPWRGRFGPWALGVGRSPHRNSQVMSGQLFAQALPAVTEFTSPRAWAFSLIGIHEYLRR